MLAITLPILLISRIVILPIVFIELLHCLEETVLLITFLWIPHYHYFLILREIHLRDPSVVEVDVAEVSRVR